MDTIITVERVREEDLHQVITLLNTLVPWEISFTEAKEAFRQLKNNADAAVLTAKENDFVVGTVTVICAQVLAAKFAVIEDVVVAEEKRGRGIGSKLMKAADDFAHQRGCTYITLVSSGHRVHAHWFYEKCGFTEDVRGFRKSC